MTDKQNEEQKRRMRMVLYDQRLISEVFPSVSKITIKYRTEHRSAFGISADERVATYLPDYPNNFVVDCLNRECTSIGFNLKDDIWQMVQNKESERSGTKDCTGSEVPNHLYQSCGSTLEYKISVDYK